MPNLSAHNVDKPFFTVTHQPTGAVVTTDPSSTHGGSSSTFEPTDLVDAALIACTGTMIFLKAKALGLETKNIQLSSSHTMADSPRRIGSIDVGIAVPVTVDERQKKSLIAAAKGCPVRNSLSADMAVRMTFTWGDGSTDVVEK